MNKFNSIIQSTSPVQQSSSVQHNHDCICILVAVVGYFLMNLVILLTISAAAMVFPPYIQKKLVVLTMEWLLWL